MLSRNYAPNIHHNVLINSYLCGHGLDRKCKFEINSNGNWQDTTTRVYWHITCVMRTCPTAALGTLLDFTGLSVFHKLVKSKALKIMIRTMKLKKI